ncbi:hypothetical protein SAMN02910456_00017 [Ruminococcaceae bacterium YRB3002]|nr:hypothetical protein SAMN02910456_00017 [Ruminococcaceae bacterium YRB3002]
MIAAFILTGCKTAEPSYTADSVETTSATAVTETVETFEFNPHVYSPKLAERIPQDYWDSFYNMCDVLRVGGNTFGCSSKEAYDWCSDASVLCNLFPTVLMRLSLL